MKGVHTRLKQELAAHSAMRENAVERLREVIAEAGDRQDKANKLIELLRPRLQKWVDAGQPDDPRMSRYAKLYMRAVEALHDAEYADQYARNLIAEHDTEHSEPGQTGAGR